MFEKQSKEYFEIYKNYTKFKFLCLWIKFYWNTAMSILLSIAYGCFQSYNSRVSSYDRDYMATKTKIFTLWCFTENKFADLWPTALWRTFFPPIFLQFGGGRHLRSTSPLQVNWINIAFLWARSHVRTTRSSRQSNIFYVRTKWKESCGLLMHIIYSQESFI